MADYLPIRKIENGIIYTKDHRYVKVVEVIPINFLLADGLPFLVRAPCAIPGLVFKDQEETARDSLAGTDLLDDGRESDIDHIPAGEFIAPRSIDFTHGLK